MSDLIPYIVSTFVGLGLARLLFFTIPGRRRRRERIARSICARYECDDPNCAFHRRLRLERRLNETKRTWGITE